MQNEQLIRKICDSIAKTTERHRAIFKRAPHPHEWFTLRGKRFYDYVQVMNVPENGMKRLLLLKEQVESTVRRYRTIRRSRPAASPPTP